MKYCRHCGIEVLDDTEYCPLCRSVLKKDGEDTSPETAYPDVVTKRKRIWTWVRLLSFIAIAAGVVCTFINYQTNWNFFRWSYIADAGIFYALWMLYLAAKETGYIHKIFAAVIGGVALVVLIDYLTGARGWAVDYVLPGSMVLVDLAFIILMIINRKNWQGYMLYQLLMILVAVIPFALIRCGVVHHPLVSEVAILSAVLVFLGTLIIGGAAARTELSRRFHI